MQTFLLQYMDGMDKLGTISRQVYLNTAVACDAAASAEAGTRL